MHDETTTLQQLERTEKKRHDAKWEAAFLAQLTHDLGEKIRAYAKRRAHFVEVKAGISDPDLSRELYQDAVTDTWTGDVTWNPHRGPLELHLRRVIKYRSSHELKRRDRFERVPIDEPSGALEQELSELTEGARTNHEGTDVRNFVDEVIEALLLLADGDEEVLQVLYCFGRDIIERRDVIEETGISATAYHNARRRMLRLVERLPQDLRDNANDVMA